jgi:hypothetical protein
MDSSSSSIITAVRDNSGRKSTNGSQNNSQAGRPKLNRNTGTGNREAVSTAATAAARAFAAGYKISPTASRKGSGSRQTRKDGKRNDADGNKSVLSTRTTSITSSNSSVSGNEAGNAKGVAGGVRRNEKS